MKPKPATIIINKTPSAPMFTRKGFSLLGFFDRLFVVPFLCFGFVKSFLISRSIFVNFGFIDVYIISVKYFYVSGEDV